MEQERKAEKERKKDRETDWKTEKEQLGRELEYRLEQHQKQERMSKADTAEVEALLKLLEQLKPLPKQSASQAYRRFEQKYLPKLQEEEAEREQPGESGGKKQGRHALYRRFLRYGGLAAALLLLLFTALNVGTYASAGVDFFSFLQQSGTGRSFVALGEEEAATGAAEEGMEYDSNNGVECVRWEDLPEEVRKRILIPEALPANMEVEKIRYWGGKYDLTVRADYQSEDGKTRLQVWIEQYNQRPTWQSVVNPEAEFVAEEQLGELLCQEYTYQDEVILFFYQGTELYTIFGNCSRQEMEAFVGSMR